MSERKQREPSNYVAEWFGHVVWPPIEVDRSEDAVKNQSEERCPFLSNATARNVPCVKKAKLAGLEIRTGFCTASSPSTGVREDWLACPWRVFDEPFTLIRDAVEHLFGVGAAPFAVFPITRFGDAGVKAKILGLSGEAADPLPERVFAFSSNPPALGGEIDIPETQQSPGNKVDVSIFEVLGVRSDGSLRLGRFAIFEIQTADFHGSPLHAVGALRELGPPVVTENYHDGIAANPRLLGDRVEGPNKANIFKRTIYQMILKIQMAKDQDCAGFCVVLPEPVWRSWARHLGDPPLVADPGRPGIVRLTAPTQEPADASLVEPEPAWILVFKIDRESDVSPKPLKIVSRIATDSAALLHFSFDVAPEAAIRAGALRTFSEAFRRRIAAHWDP